MKKTPLAALPLVLVLSSGAAAQDWPNRTVTIIVPFAAGGNTDSIARLTAELLSKETGESFVVENRPGAGGAIAAQAVAAAEPDGNTLLMAALPVLAVLPAMQTVGFDPVESFAPISIVGTSYFALGVGSEQSIDTLDEFVAYAKANPDTPYASGGTGSISHLSMVLLLKEAGIEMTHVPYQGGAPALTDVVGGHVSSYFGNVSEYLPYASDPAVEIVGVSSPARIEGLADVPTIAESGYPNFSTETWNGLVAPTGTDPAIIETIAAAIAEAAADPEFVERLAALGVEAVGNTPAEFSQTIERDIATWGEAVELSGASLQ